MKPPQTGGCLCGKIRYEISDAPRLVYTCHCTECQHLTSSAFSIALAIAGFRLTGDEPQPLESIADSGRVKIRWVCPECGCWLFSTGKPGDGLYRVRGGTLDDTSWLRPTMHFWTRSKQPWITLPGGRSDVRDAAGLGSRHFATKSSGRPAMLWPLPAHRGRCPFAALHLILEDSLLAVQSSAASNGPDTDRMGRSDHSRRRHEDIG